MEQVHMLFQYLPLSQDMYCQTFIVVSQIFPKVLELKSILPAVPHLLYLHRSDKGFYRLHFHRNEREDEFYSIFLRITLPQFLLLYLQTIG